MARDVMAMAQDYGTKKRAEAEIGDITNKVTALRAVRESQGADTNEIETLRALEDYIYGMLPDFKSAKVDGNGMSVTGGKILLAFAGQMAAFLEEADANNYRTGAFTIGPRDGMQYEFTVRRIAPGKRTPAQKNCDLMETLALALSLLRRIADVEGIPVSPREARHAIAALEHAMR